MDRRTKGELRGHNVGDSFNRVMHSLSALTDHFCSLPPVRPDELMGLWNGGSWHTGSIFGTLLRHTRWYGKEFRAEDDVDALLFLADAARPTRPLALINAAMILPFNALAWKRAATKQTHGRRHERTHGHSPALLRHPLGAARLEERELFGVRSTAMCYRYVPIVDHFRRMDDGRLMGFMEIAGSGSPELFFWLRRDAGDDR